MLTVTHGWSEDTTGTDPIRRDTRSQGKQSLECKWVNDQYICVVAITYQPYIITVLEMVGLEEKKSPK